MKLGSNVLHFVVFAKENIPKSSPLLDFGLKRGPTTTLLCHSLQISLRIHFQAGAQLKYLNSKRSKIKTGSNM